MAMESSLPDMVRRRFLRADPMQARPESMTDLDITPVEFARAIFWLILALNVAHLRNGEAVAWWVYGGRLSVLPRWRGPP